MLLDRWQGGSVWDAFNCLIFKHVARQSRYLLTCPSLSNHLCQGVGNVDDLKPILDFLSRLKYTPPNHRTSPCYIFFYSSKKDLDRIRHSRSTCMLLRFCRFISSTHGRSKQARGRVQAFSPHSGFQVWFKSLEMGTWLRC